MVRGVVAYILNNNDRTFSFTKKLSITKKLCVLYNLYDIGDNSLNYTRTANNLNLKFKQQTSRDFSTTNIYLNPLTLGCSFIIGTMFPFTPSTWIIPDNIFSNWNNSSRNYQVVDSQPVPIISIFTGKNAYFFFDSTGGLVRYIKDSKFLSRFPPNVVDGKSDTNASGLWYYSIFVTFFGEDGVRSSAFYSKVLRMKITDTNITIINAEVYIVPINKKIRDITFEYEVNEGQPKWIGKLCPVIIEYMFITEEVIT